MLSSPAKILAAVRKEIIAQTRLDPSHVVVSVTPLLTFDWFPKCVIIYPVSLFSRRSSSTDATAVGAMAAAPIQQLTELHFHVLVKTLGALDELGVDTIAFDDKSLTNPDSHAYLLQKVLTALNGLYIRDSVSKAMLSHGSVAIVTVDPIGRSVEPDERSRRKGINKHKITSIVQCYVVFQPLTWPGNFTHIVDI
jgi:hypothetical protein